MTKKKQTKKKTASKSQSGPSIFENEEVQGFTLLACSLLVFLSLLSFAFTGHSNNWLGLFGRSLGWVFHAFFGVTSYIACMFAGWLGWRLFFKKSVNNLARKCYAVALLMLSMGVLLSLFEHLYPAAARSVNSFFYPALFTQKLNYHLGGALFHYFYRDLPQINLSQILNSLGVLLLFSSTLIFSVMLLFKYRPSGLRNLFSRAPASSETDAERLVKLRIPPAAQPTEAPTAMTNEMLAIKPERDLKLRPSLSGKEAREPIVRTSEPPATPPATKREAALNAQRIHNGDYKTYTLPAESLLSNAKKVDTSHLKKDLRRQAEVLEETLLSFGIEAKVGQINCGPTITSFEVHPAIGVKVQKIKALESDIALNMEAKSIRIIAPIPGKAAVGIEVPNSQPQEVGFKEMLLAYQQGSRKFHIPILLGKAVNGDYVMSDLAKMPHCIIAGATGSGKSVCINTIVMSILLNAKPDEIKLLMVDPKKVELTPYSRLPHMLAPVITEPKGACAALHWLVKEMEKRYDLFKQLGFRNIEAFNSRTINLKQEQELKQEVPAKLHYIVGIIDELADLMMVSSNDIETPIARIAQMARAVGIHLILATQRPSREVITGLIKANFPTRISFKVASRVNSQIVLDEVGAEMLLGNGDMLFLPPGTSTLVRAQGAFIRDEDIYAVIQAICAQAPPQYVIDSFDDLGEGLGEEEDEKAAPADSLYDQAVDIVLSSGNASTTFLQRKLKIGYARAASLMDELERNGVIGPTEGSKPRKVYNKQNEEALDEEDSDLLAGHIDDLV